MQGTQLQYLELAEDILKFIIRNQADDKACALGIITDVSGGSARAVGSIFAVNEMGEMAGYVSNGCVDADLRLQMMDAIVKQRPRQLVYGAGSPFIDLRLPCGGTIKVEIDPAPNPALCLKALEVLIGRKPVRLIFSSEKGVVDVRENVGCSGWYGDQFQAAHVPRMRLVIAGSGAPVGTITRVAEAMSIPLVLMSPNVEDEAFTS